MHHKWALLALFLTSWVAVIAWYDDAQYDLSMMEIPVLENHWITQSDPEMDVTELEKIDLNMQTGLYATPQVLKILTPLNLENKEALKAQGISYFELTETDQDQGVYLGPFETEAAAEAEKNRLLKMGYETLIVEQPHL